MARFIIISIISLITWNTDGHAFTSSPENIAIHIYGNTHTKTRYIDSLAHFCIEKGKENKFLHFDSQYMEECLMNSKLFSKVTVQLLEETISIYVEDRWSLIPIPIIQISDDGETQFGFFLLESNFLGLGKGLAVGGTYSKSRTSSFLSYSDPSILFSQWGFSTVLGNSQKEILNYKGEEYIDGFSEASIVVSFTLGYQLTSHLKSSLLLHYTDKTYGTVEAFEFTPPLEDYDSLTSGVDFKWDQSNFKFYYQQGWQSSLQLLQEIKRSDESDLTSLIKGQIDWQDSLFMDQALQLRVGGAAIQNNDIRDALKVGGQKGFRGIPQEGAWVTHYMTLSMDYQIPVWSSGYGVLTLAPFLDMGTLAHQADSRDSESYLAQGIGSYFFLKQIAIPGIGIVYGRNDHYQRSFFSVSIGFSI